MVFFTPFMLIEILMVDLDTEWNQIQHHQKVNPFLVLWHLKHSMKLVI